jgi:hypothetical protein
VSSLKALMAHPDVTNGIFCVSFFEGGSTTLIVCLVKTSYALVGDIDIYVVWMSTAEVSLHDCEYMPVR